LIKQAEGVILVTNLEKRDGSNSTKEEAIVVPATREIDLKRFFFGEKC
jgi:hypothetical protein